MKIKYIVVIPARYGSSRLEGKPLLDIAGKSMINRVYEQASKSAADRVLVATDDLRIADAVAAFGGDVVMTSATHSSGTDRLHEVAERLGFAEDTIVVNVQGDEPLIPPQVIDQVARNLADRPQLGVATLCENIATYADFMNPNVVKVVTDTNRLALYFSRAAIPWPRDHFKNGLQTLPQACVAQRHIGLYAYRVRTLKQFVGWPMAPLEALEALEQLRFLWHGEAIHVAEAGTPVPGGVDTFDDLHRVTALLRRDTAQ